MQTTAQRTRRSATLSSHLLPCAAAAVLTCCPFAIAEGPPPHWDPTLGQPAVNGTIADAVVWKGDLVVGGWLASQGYVARWDESSGAWQFIGSRIPPVFGAAAVSALAVYNDELVIGGRFTTADGHIVNNIARWDESLEQWQPLGGSGSEGVTGSFDVRVAALAVHQGDLYAGGNFTQAGGNPAGSIARWDGEQWHPVGSLTGGGCGTGGCDKVRALTTYNGELIAAGRFTSADGQPAIRIARWDGEQWHPLGAGVNGPVFALAVYPAQFGDVLIVGGAFSLAGGSAANRIAAWFTPDGSPGAGSWLTLGEGVGVGVVEALSIHNADLIVGGSFATAGGGDASHLARWTGFDGEWAEVGGGTSGAVGVLLVQKNALVVGGSFLQAGETIVQNIARWDDSTRRWSPFTLNVNGEIHAVLHHKDGTIIGGKFSMASGGPVGNIARWNEHSMTWEPMGAGFAVDPYGNEHLTAARALAEYDGRVVAGGTFLYSGETQVNGIAQWDEESNQWLPLDGGGVTGCYDFGACVIGVWSLLVHEGELIVGGDFTKAGPVNAIGLARWVSDAAGAGGGGEWQKFSDLGMASCEDWIGHCSPRVHALRAHEGDIYAAGSFHQVHGLTVNHIARWDRSSGVWHAFGTGFKGCSWGCEPAVFDIAFLEGQIVAAGSFHLAGGQSARRVARWDVASGAWYPLGDVGAPFDAEDEGPDGDAHALAVIDGRLYLGGDFIAIDEKPLTYAAVWSGSLETGAWQPLDEPPNNNVRAIAVSGDALIFAGDFFAVGPHATNRIARLVHPAKIPGDLTGNGSVGVEDLLILLASWGECADCPLAPGECPADLDGDCNVGVSDLLILLANWK